jgi:hypothetical protein
MSHSTYDRALEESMSVRLSAEPELAKTVAEVLKRLRSREFYEPAFVDAVFQKWERYPINFTDAYGFMLAYTNVLTGRWRIARVTVGAAPSADKLKDDNNAKLSGLNVQFGAEFLGGAGDHDGSFWWHDHLHLGGLILVGEELKEGNSITIGPSRVALEVGYQAVGKTLTMMHRQRGFARWPYDSDHIWVFYDCRKATPVEASCMLDEEHGWPCAYTRSTT